MSALALVWSLLDLNLNVCGVLDESGVLSNALIGISLVTILSASGEGHALTHTEKEQFGRNLTLQTQGLHQTSGRIRPGAK